MSMKPETRFRLKVLDDFRRIPHCKYFAIQQQAIVGTPDFLLCINGFFIALELKASEDAKVSKLQLHNIAEVIKAKGRAYVVWPQNWQATLALLQKLAAEESIAA